MYLATRIFDHFFHVEQLKGNASCNECHPPDSPKVAAMTKACSECHKKDMMAATSTVREFKRAEAPGMRHAMHTLCIPCHRREWDKPEVQAKKPDLFRCASCHRTPIPHRQEIREATQEAEIARVTQQ
jgi:hypothetical protein